MRRSDSRRGVLVRWATVLALAGVGGTVLALPEQRAETQILVAPDGAPGDRFGAVGVSADLAAVGATEVGDRLGAVYVFRHDGSAWLHEDTLFRDGETERNLWCATVSVSTSSYGDVVIGGGPFTRTLPGVASAGAVFVFRKTEAGWVQEARLSPTDPTVSHFFGASAEVEGDVLVVGAPTHSATAAASGSLWVYRRDAAGWVREAEALVPAQVAAFDQVGTHVALSVSDGVERFVAGSPGDSEKGVRTGAVYVYRRNASGWDLEERISPDNPLPFDFAGASVALDGDVLAIGSYPNDNANGEDAGAVYVYRFDGTSWKPSETKLLASDGVAFDYFGSEVAVEGDVVVVSAMGADHLGPDRGAVYTFRWDGSAWQEGPRLVPNSTVGIGFFDDVAYSAGRALVGDQSHDGVAGVDAGAVFAFDLTDLLPVQDPDTDGDGLRDSWETQGYTAANGVFVDLPALGANPLRKDVFVELDYMVGADHSHRPLATAIQKVVDAFAAAPVENPDGSAGITLHVVVDGEIEHDDVLGETEFEGLKAQHFAPERARAFHYCIFAHDLWSKRTGVSWGAPASDFVVALGSFVGGTGNESNQAGTFMHELGHNLGLWHGGGETSTRRDDAYKPNHLSVMSYLYQLDGLLWNGVKGRFDYAPVALPPLTESALIESDGLGGDATFDLYGVRWRRGLTSYEDFTGNSDVDWNRSGGINATPVAADLNGTFTWTETLVAYDDWPNLVFTGGSVGGGTTPPPDLTPIDELDVETALTLLEPGPVDVRGHVATGLITLTWTPSGPQKDWTYTIYRGVGEGTRLPYGTTTLSNRQDDAVVAGTTYAYYVTATGPSGAESRPSEEVVLTAR